MYPVLFRIGPITIYTYGFLVFLGVLFGYLVCRHQARKDGFKDSLVADFFFWTVVSGFIGARIVYVLVEFKYFLYDPMAVLFGRSGFVFYGGVIFGFSALYILSKRNHLSFPKVMDIAALGIPLAHAFGRLGCFFYGCCYGIKTHSHIGILFPLNSPAGVSGIKVIPTQLISAGFLFLLFIALMVLRKHKKFEGYIFLIYLNFYSIFRFFIEFYRGDPRGQLLIFSTSQWISIGLFITSIVLFLRWRRPS